jgi:two-component system sensor kinase FixL
MSTENTSYNIYRQMVEQSINGMAFLKILRNEKGEPSDLQYQYLNRVAQRIMVLPMEQIIGNTLLQIYPAARYELFPKCVAAINTGIPLDYVYHYNQEGYNTWFRIMVIPMGENVSLTFTNITEQMHLKLSEANNRKLIESAPDGVIAINKKSEITLWNRKAEDMFGWTNAEVLGRTLTETIIPEKLRDAHLQGMDRFMATGIAHVLNTTVELTALRKGGEEFFISLTISQIPGTDSDFLAFIRDISSARKNARELMQAKLELERSNTELEQFAYVAAHDLQEPLRTISSYLQLIERSLAKGDSGDAAEYIKVAKDSSNRMRELIRNLLEYSNIGLLKPLIHINLNEVIQKVLSDLSQSIQDSEAKIEIGLLPVIRGDAEQMYQLFLNLLNNGLKFRSSRKPLLQVAAVEKEDHFLISVRDNGIGIDKVYEEKIFKMFQRLHSRDTYPGTGIGLAICKKIVENHRGRIRVESLPGQETVFFIELPKEH